MFNRRFCSPSRFNQTVSDMSLGMSLKPPYRRRCPRQALGFNLNAGDIPGDIILLVEKKPNKIK